MKIAIVHSYYSSRNPSGESAAVDDQAQELAAGGHDVRLVVQRTDDREALPLYRLRTAIDVAFGSGPDPTSEIDAFSPDIVHVHNLFPNFGTRWLRNIEAPVVATVQNFRPICAAGTLYRDGDVCTLCPDGHPWSSVRYGCYRGSNLATAPIAWRNRRGVLHDAVLSRADRVVCVAKRSVDAYAAAGAEVEKYRVVPNFARRSRRNESVKRTGPWLFAGRITEEKGLGRLLSHWPDGEALDVLGDGPDFDRCRGLASTSVRFLGAVGRHVVLEHLATTQGLVFPSRWFEGLPVVVMEALSVGAPLIAARGSSAADLIEESGAGVLVPREYTTQHLVSALLTVGETDWQRKNEQLYESRFSPSAWVRGIEQVYSEATACHSLRQSGSPGSTPQP